MYKTLTYTEYEAFIYTKFFHYYEKLNLLKKIVDNLNSSI